MRQNWMGRAGLALARCGRAAAVAAWAAGVCCAADALPPQHGPPRIVVRGQSLFEDYLRRRLPADAGVQLDDGLRSSAILGEIAEGGDLVSAPSTYSGFCAFSPVEALVFVGQADGDPQGLALTIHSPGGIWEKRYTSEPGKPGSLLAMMREALADVADRCGLSPEGRDALLDIGFPKDEVLRSYASARAYIDSRVNFNIGEERIRRLLPALAADPTNVLIAAEVLRNAEALHAASLRSMAFSERAIKLSQEVLPYVLGTPHEPAAHAIVRRFPERFEEVLMAQAGPLLDAQEADLEGLLEDAADAGLGAPAAAPPKGPAPTAGRALGALRLLGVAASKRGLPVLLKASRRDDPAAREAAADGLGGYREAAARERLRALASDADERVACAAALALWAGGERTERLLALARERTGGRDPRKVQALAVLEAAGEAQDAPALRRLCGDPSPDVRLAAARGLIRLGAMDEPTLAGLLADGHRSVLSLALSAVPSRPSPDVQAHVRRLARDPIEAVAELARMSLAPLRPADERGAIAFDLELEHLYIRLRQVTRLCASRAPWSTELLDASCTNRDVYVSAAAIAELARRDPERGRERARAALRAPSAWLRFAAAEVLAAGAQKADAPLLAAALQAESDAATRVSLRESLARAEGRPAPAPPAAARRIAGERGLVWNHTGPGDRSPQAPFTGYYEPAINRLGSAEQRARGYASGKIVMGRCKPEAIANPGLFVLDARQRDACWRTIDETLVETNLAYADAFVVGDELMNAGTSELWPGGWRLFCLEAGIDPARVRGVHDNLSAVEQRAWADWARARCVEGFNAIHDYVKWKVARLRPGIQICTFMPMIGARFDVIGVRNLTADNRSVTYNRVRQCKTLWPGCPVVCFVFGIVDRESNSIQRGWMGPPAPILDRRNRAYADALTAYMAGADVGWWSGWSVHEPAWKEGSDDLGRTVSLESLYPGSEVLSNAIEHAFANAARMDAEKSVPEAPAPGGLATADDELPAALDIVGEQRAADAAGAQAARLAAEQRAMAKGLLYYGLYATDCVRLLADLPRQSPKPEALAIASDTRTPAPTYPAVPALALLNQYDFAGSLGAASSLDLARYRLILVHAPGELLRDAALDVLDRWLREQTGLLYIHGAVETDNASEASVVGDLDGRLTNDWPWEADIELRAVTNVTRAGVLAGPAVEAAGAIAGGEVLCTYAPRNGSARVLATDGDRPVLVLWQRPERFKGAVLFDGIGSAPPAYIEALRGVLNGLRRDAGIGLALEGRRLHEVLDTPNLLVAASPGEGAGARDPAAYKGLDLLTGQVDPVVGDGASGAMIGRDFIGTYAAGLSGLAILSTRPLAGVERIPNGVRLSSDGLVRVSCEGGTARVVPDGGAALPEVKEPEDWIVFGSGEGAAALPLGPDRAMVWFRCDRPVTITRP